MKTLAIFDLDNTLLAGDSDHAWGEFLISEGLADAESHRQQNDAFYAQYQQGTLDMTEYLEFAVSPVVGYTQSRLAELHIKFMQQFIDPIMLPSAQALVDSHKNRGDICLIVTATNRFVTEPISRRLGVHDLIATDLEYLEGVLTGKISGAPCFQAGKITKLKSWLETNSKQPEYQGLTLENSVFYSDSFNDIPLLEAAGKAVAVDPDDKLRAHASNMGWPVISLRQA
ncbi:MAG TPA: HAD-IB family hydrolase [Pseudohongiella sp.]|nr:HAD-IB family hydrolase [Pseudohongiella sp.]|tara:strand:+ start:59719 stop:60402 length:684 start_codon:yes stop_codon:yes gene_type:complete